MKISYSQKWHVIYTRPQTEKKVSCQLTDMGIRHLLPMKKETRKWHDRKKIVDVPLFPSYIFVQPVDVKSYFDVLDLYAVVNYIKVGKEVAVVSEATINSINILLERDCGVTVSTERFKIGQTINITEGQFSGLACEVVSIGKKDFLLVRVEVFNRHLLIDLPGQSLGSPN
jgi:transcriptional antiterminator RfaH